MIFRSPYPDIEIPEIAADPLRPAPRRAAGRQTGADRRTDRTDADLRSTRRGACGARRPGWRPGATARAMSSPSSPPTRSSSPSPSTRSPPSAASRRRSTQLHRRRDRRASSAKPERAACSPSPELTRPGAGSGEQLRHPGDHRLRRGARCDALRLAARERRTAARRRHRSARGCGRHPLLERHDGAAEGVQLTHSTWFVASACQFAAMWRDRRGRHAARPPPLLPRCSVWSCP